MTARYDRAEELYANVWLALKLVFVTTVSVIFLWWWMIL